MQHGFLRSGVVMLAISLASACTGPVGVGAPAAQAPARPAMQAAAADAVPVALRIPGSTAAGPATVQLTVDMARQALHRGELEIELADGTRYPVRMEREQAERGGQATFVGRVETKVGPQTAVLTFGPDAVFGVLPRPDGMLLSVTTTRGITSIGPAGGMVPEGKGTLATHPDALIPPLSAALAVPGSRAEGMHPGVRAGDGGDVRQATTTLEAVNIDILGLYDQALVELRGSASAAETEVTNLVAIANQAHADSGSRVEFSMVGLQSIAVEPGMYNQDLLHAITDNEVGDVDVHRLRNQVGADLVFVVRPYIEGDPTCGIGWLQGAYMAGADVFENYAFSVGSVDPCGPYVLAHELGHNLGSTHDRGSATLFSFDGVDQYGAYPYSFGYRQDTDPVFATIMAYQEDRPWLGYFSNPGLMSCGAPCGVVDQADNVRSLNRMAATVAGMRGRPGTLSIADAEVVEPIAGDLGWAWVRVRYTGDVPAGGIDFSVRATGGSATQYVDFQPPEGRLRLTEGQVEASFMLGIIGDDLVEGDETIALRLVDVANAQVDDAQAVVTIVDDDPRPRIEGRLLFPEGSTPPGSPVRMSVRGPDGYAYSQREIEVLPPDFRYSIPVAIHSDVTLDAELPGRFAALRLDVGQVDGPMQRDYPVHFGYVVSGKLRIPAGGPEPEGSVMLTIRESFQVGDDNQIQPVRYAHLERNGDEYRFSVVPGSWVSFEANGYGPYQPVDWVFGRRADADVVRDITLSTLPTLSVNPNQQPSEGNEYGATSIVLSAPAPEGGVTFFYHTVSGTAKAYEDYEPVRGTMTIPEGETYGSVVVRTFADDVVEGEEYFDLEVADVRGAMAVTTRGRTYMPDNPVYDRPSLHLFGSSPATEGQAGVTNSVRIGVRLSEPAPASGVSLYYHTMSGTAKTWEDYVPASGWLDFAEGEDTRYLYVDTLGDDLPEVDEYFYVEVAHVGGARVPEPKFRLLLRNDD